MLELPIPSLLLSVILPILGLSEESLHEENPRALFFLFELTKNKFCTCSG